ncbi:ABC transporter ATP-binding protein [Paenibacillus sp. 481]|uniref:ABC transporter ATP-binding protein n=1 Tax=Paenibacillus sp. 481 TaxID=2835869 RepID=UPI001E37A5EE|nr:ABC transporter ATP-binding protein [Paenibacillus sp. 481]UHA75256.1 ABC transporter ATP-binding protein [Paenibacillus sp. 481]
MGKLNTEQLNLSYGEATIVRDVNLDIPEGKITILIGANGCGKSTLLRSLARLLKPTKGVVYLDGKDIHQQSTKEVARKLAILPQGPIAPDGLTVRELCEYGRHPHRGMFSRSTAKDREMVDWAIEATRLKDKADTPLDSLSGGQRQRAWIAMALAQETELLLLDEPTTYLDLAHQLEVLELIRQINRTHGRTIVIVLHDLNQAAQYAHHLLSIKDGQIYSEGAPADVFTEQMIRDVFGVECRLFVDPIMGTPMCVPICLQSCAKDGGTA